MKNLKESLLESINKYEDDRAVDYDAGDGKIGNYSKPVHSVCDSKVLYNKLNNNRHFWFVYGLDEKEIMSRLKQYNGKVRYSTTDNAGHTEIYRIEFLK